MVFSSLATVALQWRTLARAFTLFKKTERPAHSAAMDAIEVPFSWLVVGLIPITIGMAVVQYLAFHISHRAGADCRGAFLRRVPGLLPGDRRDGHDSHRRHGQADAVALRRLAGRKRCRLD